MVKQNRELTKKERLEANCVGLTPLKRAKMASQPKGGYLKLSQFTKIQCKPKFDQQLNDYGVFSYIKNVIPFLEQQEFEMELDLRRDDFESCFDIDDDDIFEEENNESIMCKLDTFTNSMQYGTDHAAIENALTLVLLDDLAFEAPNNKFIEQLNNIHHMKFPKVYFDYINNFLNAIGPIDDMYIDNMGNYTKIIGYDDDNFRVKDTLFITIPNDDITNLNETTTLRILIDYLMYIHNSLVKHEDIINYLGIYNFSKNTIYKINVKDIDKTIIDDVNHKVIGYKNDTEFHIFFRGMSVTSRVKSVKQPYGGFLQTSKFSATNVNNDKMIIPSENINPTSSGMIVDYLTRLEQSHNVEDAFSISLEGSKVLDKLNAKRDITSPYGLKHATELLSHIQPGLSDESIINAVKLVQYDDCYRRLSDYVEPSEEINPESIEHVRTLVNRVLRFFEIYGPITESHVTFKGGYTRIINTGDGDYLTKDTLWDLKVSKATRPDKNWKLQILVYYLLGLHSEHKDKYKKLKYLGIYNARTNIVYRIEISKIDPDIIDEVNTSIIGYDK